MHEEGVNQLGVFPDVVRRNLHSCFKGRRIRGCFIYPLDDWSCQIIVINTAVNQAGQATDGSLYMIAPFAKAPEIILPVGQTPYWSKVTNREEWLPASMHWCCWRKRR